MQEAPRLPPSLKRPLMALCYLGFAAFFFIFGFTLGDEPGTLSLAKEPGEVTGTHEDEPEWLPGDVPFDLFWEVWDLARQEFVSREVSDKDLFYGALQGLVWGLDDPYSVFFTPQLAAEFTQELSGTFFGIGAEIGVDDAGNIVIVAPLPETPAEQAGVRPGDRILFVDDTDTLGLSVPETVQLIRGEKGTTVVLTLLREGGEPFQAPIIRDEITVDSVTHEIREDGIGVITISMFNEDTEGLFDLAVKEFLAEGVDQVVIDLRNNPGGFLDGAINLAGYWVGDDVVVIEAQGEEREEFRADGAPWFGEIETVVLVNGGSASAAEILAGALQDYGLATVIGEQTFGKGTVQQYHELKDGSALKITIAEWLTPLGRSIEESGITPDIIVPVSEESHDLEDPQLDAALNFLKGP